MADNFTDKTSGELLYSLPAQPVEREIKWSWPTYEVPRECFDRRDDSLRARKFARHLDTFRQVPPDDRDIQRLAERHGTRYLMIQVCANGTAQANRTIWREVMQDARMIGAEQQAQTQATQAAPLAASTTLAHAEQSSAAGRFNEAVEVLEATERMVKKVMPQQPTESVETVVERALARQREEFNRTLEQMKAAQPAQPTSPPLDPFAFMERSLSLQEQMRQAALASNPLQQTAPPPDAAESFLSQFEKFTEISERINPIRECENEDRGLLDKAFGAVEGFGKMVPVIMPMLAPLLPAHLQAMLAGADASDAAPVAETQPQATQPPQQPAQAARAQPAAPQNESEAMTLIAHVAVSEMIKNKRPGKTADLIEDLAARFPALVQTVAQLLALPPESVLTTLGQFVGRNDLASFRHARDWILDLVNELSPDDEAEPESDQLAGDVPSLLDMAHAQSH